MNNTKTYSEHLAKLNALRDEILGIKRDPTAEERKIEAEYAVAFKDMLHTGMPQNALKEYTRTALSFLIENREALIEDGRLVKAVLSDHNEIDAELSAVAEEMEVVAG